MKKNFLTLGITGGIASGKSTVAKTLEAEGIPVLDADQLARELSSPGGLAAPAILKRFSTLDRPTLRALIFKDAQAKKDLEAILHPVIQQESLKRLEALAGNSRVFSADMKPWVAYEAILLLEAGRVNDIDFLLLIESPEEVRKQRLLKRDCISETLADTILKSQTTDENRRLLGKGVPSFVLTNASSEATLETPIKEQIRNLVLELRK